MKRIIPLLLLSMMLWPQAAVAYTPYAAMYKAFKDPRAYRVQAQDKRLVLEVKAALLRDGLGTAVDISVECLMGRVFLVGEVPDQAAADKTRSLAAGISEVRSVDCFLPIKGKTPGDASGMKVRKALIGDAGGEALTLSVKAVGGTVALMGLVASTEDKTQALATAKAVPGVDEVKDFLLLPEADSEKRQGPAGRVLGRIRDR